MQYCGAMNFQKWEIFSGSPGILLQTLTITKIDNDNEYPCMNKVCKIIPLPRRERQNVKKQFVKVKLRFSAPSAGIAEITKRKSSPRPLVMTLKGAGGI